MATPLTLSTIPRELHSMIAEYLNPIDRIHWKKTSRTFYLSIAPFQYNDLRPAQILLFARDHPGEEIPSSIDHSSECKYLACTTCLRLRPTQIFADITTFDLPLITGTDEQDYELYSQRFCIDCGIEANLPGYTPGSAIELYGPMYDEFTYVVCYRCKMLKLFNWNTTQGLYSKFALCLECESHMGDEERRYIDDMMDLAMRDAL